MDAFNDMYGGGTIASAPQTAVGNYPAATGVNTPQVANSTMSASPASAQANNAPTISWVAIVAVLVLIRVAYERGARLE